jgi:plastocyanin
MSPNVLRGFVSIGLSGLIGAAAFVLVGLIAAPPAQAGDPCYHGQVIPSRTDAAETQIKVGPCFFGPTVARVPIGATVTFFNGPGFTHLITGANAEWGSRDEELKPDASVAYTFDKPGVYPYACALHRGMSGAIVVGDATGAAAVTTSQPSLTPAPAAAQTGDEPAPAVMPTVVAGTGFGILVGAAGLWVVGRVTRRRSTQNSHTD